MAHFVHERRGRYGLQLFQEAEHRPGIAQGVAQVDMHAFRKVLSQPFGIKGRRIAEQRTLARVIEDGHWGFRPFVQQLPINVPPAGAITGGIRTGKRRVVVLAFVNHQGSEARQKPPFPGTIFSIVPGTISVK